MVYSKKTQWTSLVQVLPKWLDDVSERPPLYGRARAMHGLDMPVESIAR